MRPVRTAAAVAVVALLGASVSLAPATAATAGVGTAITTTKVLNASIGGGAVLDVTLLGDEGRATNDPAVASPEAYSRLVAARVRSDIGPSVLADVSVPSPPLESRSPGGQAVVEYGGIALPTPAAVASGSINPARLTSSLDGSVATSALTAGVNDVSALGGLLRVESVNSTLGTSGAGESAEATRAASVGSITVLDLGAILQGLGINLADLPIGTITKLVDQLALQVTGTPATATLNNLVAQLNGAITTLRSTVDPVAGTVTGVVDSTTSALLQTVNVTAPTSTSATVAQVQAVIDSVQALITNLVANGLTALEGAALLKLEGLEVGVAAKAADTVANSAATVTGKIGGISIGGLKIAGLDVAAVASQVNAKVAEVNSTIAGVLGTVHPDLANLVNVAVLESTKSVTSGQGYVRSQAGIVGAAVTITPPAALASIVATVTGAADTATKVLGSAVPALSSTMTQLQTTLNSATAVLTKASSIRVAEVLAASNFTPASAPGTDPTLPRTGGVPVFAFVGALLAAAALTVRRIVAAR